MHVKNSPLLFQNKSGDLIMDLYFWGKEISVFRLIKIILSLIGAQRVKRQRVL